MDSRLENINLDEITKNRIEVAEKLMSILDEDGQPMYNEDWIKQHILGISDETENPE